MTSPLSPREREVLGMLLSGMRHEEIAAALHITRGTIGKHVAAIVRKSGERSPIAAAVAIDRAERT